MDCEKERKLFKLRTDAENKFRSISLPPAMEPLRVKTPPGHKLTIERREKIHRAEEKLNAIKETYQNHIKNCLICNKLN